jgi:hypothetical protein
MWIAARQSVCALGISAALVAGVVSAPPAVTPRPQAIQVVHVSDVTLAAVSSASPTASAVTPAGLVLVALVKTITFVELWAIVAVDIVGAPVLAPLYWFASSFIGWGPRNPIDAVARYLEAISQDLVRAIQYPFTGISGAAAATGNNVQSSSAPASRQVHSTPGDLAAGDLPGAGTGKGHSALRARSGASIHDAAQLDQAVDRNAAKHVDTHKTGTGSAPEHRPARGHGARVHASSRDD